MMKQRQRNRREVETVRDIVKRVVSEQRWRSYHAAHVRKARLALEVICRETGIQAAGFRRECDEYATEVLGWKGYAPWLYVYTAVAGEFREGWIPDNYYGSVVVPAINGHHGTVSSLKSMTSMLLGSPNVPDIAVLVNGLCVTRDGVVVARDRFHEFLFSHADRVVYKADRSTQGRDVIVLTADDVDTVAVTALGNGVFQRYVHQHEDLERMVASSVATIRMTTVTDAMGRVSVRAAYLRLGTGSDTHVRSASNVRVRVDTDTGELGVRGYLPDWRSVDAHPDSGAVFAGTKLPRFRECHDVVIELHARVPYVRCIGWDVAVDENGEVRVLEWNGEHNDIKFSEAVGGPCFADLGWELMWRHNVPTTTVT